MKTHELLENKILKFTPKTGIRRPRLVDEMPTSETGVPFVRFEAREKNRSLWYVWGIREDDTEQMVNAGSELVAQEFAEFYNEALQHPGANLSSLTAARWKKRFENYLPEASRWRERDPYDGYWFYVPQKYGDVYRINGIWYDLHELLNQFGEDAENEHVDDMVFGPEPVKLKKTKNSPSGVYLTVEPEEYGPGKSDNVTQKDMDILIWHGWLNQA